MHIFVLLKIEQVKGKINFYKLQIDGRCEFDEFCEVLEKAGERTTLNTIYATMESVANLKFLPRKKFWPLKGRKKNDIIKDYEIKKDENKVYLFKDEAGNIIVFGSTKNNQKEDIVKLRKLKIEYNKSKNHDNKGRTIKK